jgi:Flp pilus assembly secretin CpaC
MREHMAGKPEGFAMHGCRTLIKGLLLLLMAGSLDARAESPVSIMVTMDEASLVRLNADAQQIIVGNPSIADVAAQGSRLLIVTGKSYGSTNLIALDGSGRTILSARLGVAPNSDQLVTVYRGTLRQSLHCAPDCQHMLAIGDDKTRFEQLAESVQRKLGVANSVIGAP